MPERVIEEWIVILEDHKEREELLMPLCPGAWISYRGVRWRRETASPLKIATYYPEKEPHPKRPNEKPA